MEPPDPDEITTSSVASFVVKCNPRMAQALGGSVSLNAAISEIGIFDTDDEDAAAGLRYPCTEDGEDEEVPPDLLPAAKKRRVFGRLHKSGSHWWKRYLCAEMKAEMTAEPEGRVATRFRRNFRVPFSMFDTQLLTMTVQRWWPTWSTDKVDACGRPVSDIQLKLLGCLHVLGTGNSQFQVSELTDISEEVHRCFFLSWLSKMASVKAEFIYFPVDDESYRFVVDEYASMGLPGCVGSVDCVHVGWDKCPSPYKNMYCGKEKYPSVAYEVVCTSRKFIQSVSCGHPGSRNDKHIARTDAAIMNLLEPNDWLGGKSWEVICDSEGRRKVFHGSYLLCNGGYHRWPCLVFPLKTGLPGSTERKWAGMIESVRKDIEDVFGILKMHFNCLKQFSRLHSQRDIDNCFVTCCILHNMLLKNNGYLEPDLAPHPAGLTKILRKVFASVTLDGLWRRGDDDTHDPVTELEEMRQNPQDKARLAKKWKSVMEGLMNHYHFGS